MSLMLTNAMVLCHLHKGQFEDAERLLQEGLTKNATGAHCGPGGPWEDGRCVAWRAARGSDGGAREVSRPDPRSRACVRVRACCAREGPAKVCRSPRVSRCGHARRQHGRLHEPHEQARGSDPARYTNQLRAVSPDHPWVVRYAELEASFERCAAQFSTAAAAS